MLREKPTCRLRKPPPVSPSRLARPMSLPDEFARRYETSNNLSTGANDLDLLLATIFARRATCWTPYTRSAITLERHWMTDYSESPSSIAQLRSGLQASCSGRCVEDYRPRLQGAGNSFGSFMLLRELNRKTLLPPQRRDTVPKTVVQCS